MRTKSVAPEELKKTFVMTRKPDVGCQITAPICLQRYKNLMPSVVKITIVKYIASSYTNAMRSLCVDCHKQKAIELAGKPNRRLYAARYISEWSEYKRIYVAEKYLRHYFNYVALPVNNSNEEGY